MVQNRSQSLKETDQGCSGAEWEEWLWGHIKIYPTQHYYGFGLLRTTIGKFFNLKISSGYFQELWFTTNLGEYS